MVNAPWPKIHKEAIYRDNNLRVIILCRKCFNSNRISLANNQPLFRDITNKNNVGYLNSNNRINKDSLHTFNSLLYTRNSTKLSHNLNNDIHSRNSIHKCRMHLTNPPTAPEPEPFLVVLVTIFLLGIMLHLLTLSHQFLLERHSPQPNCSSLKSCKIC